MQKRALRRPNQPGCLRHRVGIFTAVLHGLEAQAGSVHVRVLRAFFRRHVCKFVGDFIRGPRNSTEHETLE